MRAILPGIANDTISVLKGTSVASVIFVNELTFRSQQIVGQNFKFFTVFAATGVIYLFMTSAIAGVQLLLERRFNFELERPAPGASAFDRMFGRGRIAAAANPVSTAPSVIGPAPPVAGQRFLRVGRLGGYYDLHYYRACDHLIGNTVDIVDYLLRSGWPAARAHYLPNFVDATRAAPLARSSVLIRERASGSE